MPTFLSPFFQRLFQPTYRYANLLEQQRAQALMIIPFVGTTAFLIFILNFLPVVVDIPVWQRVLVTAISYAVVFFIYTDARDGRLGRATAVYTAILTLTTLPAVAFVRETPLLVIALPLIGVSLLLGRRGVLLVLVLIALTFAVRFSIQARDRSPERIIPAQLVLVDASVSTSVIIVGALFLTLFSAAATQYAQSATRDIRHLRASQRLLAAPAPSPETLIGQMLYLLQQQLDYELAQYFSIGEDGRIARRYRLNPADDVRRMNAGQNVGQNDDREFERELLVDTAPADDGAVLAALSGTRLISAADGDIFASHLVGSARYALLVPVRAPADAEGRAGRIVGVISVQAPAREDFSPATLETFDALAANVGYRIIRLNAFAELQQDYEQQEQALLQARSQLAELRERTSGGLLGRMGAGNVIGFDLIPQALEQSLAQSAAQAGLFGLKTQPARDLPPDILETLERGEIYVERGVGEGAEQRLRVPITLRGEVLGAMAFTLPGERPVTERQLDLVRTVANRLALALENNQLFQQTQAQAQRERKASQIATQLLTATDIDRLMNMAAANFREALGAVFTGVYLAPETVAPAEEKSLSSPNAPTAPARPANGRPGTARLPALSTPPLPTDGVR